MKLKQLALGVLLVPFGAGLLSVVASTAMAQIGLNRCDPKGAVQPGTIVYDSRQGVCWLADANLAGKPKMRAQFPVPGFINPNGTMEFNTAQSWVAALNQGAGYLGHNNWQLPVTPPKDLTCASYGPGKQATFGPGCTGSAMGRIYPASYPDSVAPGFGVPVTQFFQDLKLSYYWTEAKDERGGQKVFAFSNLSPGGVTTTFPYYYVLPMIVGKLADAPTTCPTPLSGVLPYTSGVAASKAVYDCQTDRTWVADGNLAGAAQNQNTFGITGNIKITSNRGTIFKVPKIDKGAMLFETAEAMIANMKKSGYLGSVAWQLPPDPGSLKEFAKHMGLVAADATLMFKGSTGPFKNLQPFYYWGCQQDQPGMIQSPCTGFALSNDKPMQWTFNFDDGFQGTAYTTQKFFVMVYFPVPPCSNPMECCLEAGGQWFNNQCKNKSPL